jgi:Tol biopolymer transport system component
VKTSVIVVICVVVSVMLLSGGSVTRADAPAAVPPAAPKLKVNETSLGKMDGKDKMSVVSPDARHVAVIVTRDKKYIVALDGVEGKPYDDVKTPFFSPDSKHLAYVARRERAQYVVLDGIEGKPFELLESILFSPDSQHLAYTASTRFKWNLVMDGVEAKEPTGRIYDLTFSPDSKRLAYGADAPNGKKRVVVDAEKGKEFDSIKPKSLVFSPDSKRVAYVAWSGENELAVIDGAEQKGYKNEFPSRVVRDIMFSPDSKRVAYIVESEKTQMAVIDGNEGKKYTMVAAITFSPDSLRVAYVAGVRGDKWEQYAVLNGVEGKAYLHVEPRLFFSPDSNHFFYYSSTGDDIFMVTNGVEGKMKCRPDSDYRVVMSPDAKHVTFITRVEGRPKRVVLDDVVGKQYKSIMTEPIFSPDSKHVAYIVDDLGKYRVVVGAKESEPYDEQFGNLLFDAPGKLHTVMFRNGEFFLLEIEITE